MNNDSDLNRTQFFCILCLKTLENQTKCQSNVSGTVLHPSFPADNMEEYKYNILAQNIDRKFLIW